MSNITLYEAFKGWKNTEFFGKCVRIPNGFLSNARQELDLIMISNYGNRTITNMVNNCRLSTSNEEPLSEGEREEIGEVINTMFFEKWERISNSLIAEYDVLDNVTEETEVTDIERFTHGKVSTEVTKDLTTTESGTLTHGKTSTETVSGVSTDTDSTKYGKVSDKNLLELNHNSDTSVYAFDSTGPSPYEKVTESSNSNEKTIDSGEDIVTKTTNDKVNKSLVDGGADTNERKSTVNGETATTNSGTDESVKTHTVKRHGNIGVTSSQHMITQEIEMRVKYQLAKIITDDVGKFLTLQVYA